MNEANKVMLLVAEIKELNAKLQACTSLCSKQYGAYPLEGKIRAFEYLVESISADYTNIYYPFLEKAKCRELLLRCLQAANQLIQDAGLEAQSFTRNSTTGLDQKSI